jgi:L-rhamnose 1-dehydrogenase
MKRKVHQRAFNADQRRSVTPSLLYHTVHTNLNGAYFCTQAAAVAMSSQTPPGGSIIGVSSISALVGGGQQTHYTPTKAGVLSLMQSAAIALGKHNIRCNALLPGTIQTQLNEADLSVKGKREHMEGRIPLGRLGVPEDMLGPAVFLASESSAYVVSVLPTSELRAPRLTNHAIDWSAAASGRGGFCQLAIKDD